MDLGHEVRTRAARFGGSNPQQLEYLLNVVARMPADKCVPALLSIFAEGDGSEAYYEQQQLAGSLLMGSSHKCPISPRDVLSLVLGHWNLSIEELPYFLERSFGRNAVQEAVSHLKSEPQTAAALRQLDTISWWLRQSPSVDQAL